jgi:hypothetical protein
MRKIVLPVVLILAFGASAAAQSSFYTGSGGRGITLAVLEPDGPNLPATETWIPAFIQGILTSNFSRYSAMTVIDRQNMDRILAEQELSTTGNFSDENYIRLGALINARNILAGTIFKTSDTQYSLQLSISDAETGERKASFTKIFTQAELTSGVTLNQASTELLAQMGVTLSDAGMTALQSFQSSSVDAQTALAKGITAQRSGTVVEAMNYYYQAASFDSSLMEAAGRLSNLSTTISSGNIGQNLRNDVEQRSAWIATLRESAAYFHNHPPFEVIYDPSLTQGEVNYQRETANLSFNIQLWSIDSSFATLNDLLQGLERTGRRSPWGLSSWPFEVSGIPDVGVFLSSNSRDPRRNIREFSVNAALVNDRGITIGNASVNLSVPSFSVNTSGGTVSLPTPGGILRTVTFQNVDIYEITDSLVVRILRVNGVDAETAGRDGYMAIRVENDTTEPNNDRSAAAAIAINSRTRASFGPSDLDWYRVSIPGAGILTVSTESAMDTYLSLYDGTGPAIATDDDSGSGNNARITSTVSRGDYYIEAKPYSGSGAGPYILVSRFDEITAEQEPNDTWRNANLIDLNKPSIAASFSGSGDLDLYRLEVPAAGSLVIYTEGSLDTVLTLYDSNRQSIATDDDSGSGSNARIERPVQAGTYYIEAKPYGGAGSYTLKIHPPVGFSGR